MAFRDLREWLAKLEADGELHHIKVPVDWRGEVGAISRRVLNERGPALLFENIIDHQNGDFRKLLHGSLASTERVAMMLGLPKDATPRQMVQLARQRFKERIAPVVVSDGPVKQNILKTGIELNRIPVPKWHPLDGGRYINTCCGVVTRDPDTGILNIGIYRGMIAGPDKISVLLVAAQHWGIHFHKYAKRGQAMPVAVVYGLHPALEFAAAAPVAFNVPEYEIMGALNQEPVELVRCETNDLLVPAAAEIVAEGTISPDPTTFLSEGPFGEYAGYYVGKAKPRPVIEVSCLSYRSDPIFQGILAGAGPGNPTESSALYGIASPAMMLNILETAGVPGILDVKPGPITMIKIDQIYQGQARQAAMALWSSTASEYAFKNIMVVNEDIDIYNPMSVDWAFANRVNHDRDLLVIPGTRGGLLDPSNPEEMRDEAKYGTGQLTRLLIDATWDMGSKKDWFGFDQPPKSFELDEQDVDLVESRWAEYGFKKS